MLDAAFWQDAGDFWTERPAWTSDEDVSLDASSLGLAALEVTTRSDALIAINPLAIGFAAHDPDMVVLTVVEADTLPMTVFLKDYDQFIESLVLADVVGLGVLQEEAASGYVVRQEVDFVPVSLVPRDPYIFTEVTLTPEPIPLSMGAVGDHLYGVLQVIEADPLALAVEGQFYYFAITSSLPLDFLASEMAVSPFTVVADSLILADSLALASALYDAPPVSHCLVPVDPLGMGIAQDDPGTQWDSLLEAPGLALYVAFAAPVQRTSFVFDQATAFSLSAAILAAGVAVDVSASPSLLLMTADAGLAPGIVASSNIPTGSLGIGVAILASQTSRSEGFKQPAALSSAMTLLDITYAGRMAFEVAMLSTPITRSLVVSTPVNIIQGFETPQGVQ